MKTMLCAAFAAFGLIPAIAAAAPRLDVTLSPGREVSVDLGCSNGYIEKDRWPTVVYDQQTHERISYNISRCTGGYIRGVSDLNGKFWRADVRPDGSMAGRDLDGARWRYDARARLYTNLTTGRTCAKTSLRHVCGA